MPLPNLLSAGTGGLVAVPVAVVVMFVAGGGDDFTPGTNQSGRFFSSETMLQELSRPHRVQSPAAAGLLCQTRGRINSERNIEAFCVCIEIS
jgi:hypothetical protein